MRTNLPSTSPASSPFIFLVLPLAMAASLAVPTAQAADGDLPPVPANAAKQDFEADSADTAPNDFLPGRPGRGGNANWKIVAIPDAPSGSKALAQLDAQKIRARFPHLTKTDLFAADVDISVKFKTVTGGLDQAAGIVFRYRDSKTYHVVRASVVDGNVVAFRTELGQPSNLGVKGKKAAYGVKTRVLPRRWNSLRVIAKGPLIQVFFNGEKLFEVEDDSYIGTGGVGLWTRADSVVYFDDFVAAGL